MSMSRVVSCTVGGGVGGFPCIVLIDGAVCITLVFPVRTCGNVCLEAEGSACEAGTREVVSRHG